MIEVGRLCVKTAGRDAGLQCVIIDILDNKFVLIDGQTRRRKCNVLHLEPLKDVIKLKKNASHDEVKKAFEKLKLKVRETKPKPKTEKQVKQPKRAKKQKEDKPKKEKPKKKAAKKETKEKKESTLEEKAGLGKEGKK